MRVILLFLMMIIIAICYLKFATHKEGALSKKVVLIMVDTLRRDYISPYGTSINKTPFLSEFINEAVVFEDAISQAPNTRSSMISMITSRYPEQTGIFGNMQGLNSAIEPLTLNLRTQGVLTALFSGNGVLVPPVKHSWRDKFFDFIFPENFNFKGLEDGKVEFEQLREPLFSWLENNSNKNFFCWIHLMEPHMPYDSGNLYRQEGLSGYEAEVRKVDDHIASIIQKIKELDIFSNTMIIISSDHGEALGERNWYGHDYELYDELIRVPLIIRYPGKFYGSRRFEAVELVDLMPTVFDFFEQPRPAGIMGLGLFNTKEKTRTFQYSSRYFRWDLHNKVPAVHLMSIRKGYNKYIFEFPFSNNLEFSFDKEAISSIPKKLDSISPPTVKIYNLNNDPTEVNPIIKQSKGSEEEKVLNDWRNSLFKEELGDPHSIISNNIKKDEEDLKKLKSLGYLK